MKGIIKKKYYYVIELENNDSINIDEDELKSKNLKENDIVFGDITIDYIQDKYNNGEYARSYSEIKKFKINENK